VDKVKKWWQSERFLKTKRPYTAEEVVRLRSPLTRGQLLSPLSLAYPLHAACLPDSRSWQFNDLSRMTHFSRFGLVCRSP
jgi:hypothetical protein